jgi:uncharacterized protein YraI
MQILLSSLRTWLTLSLGLFALAVVSPAWAGETVYAQTGGVVVYSSPSPAAPQITSRPAGAGMFSHGAEGEWLNVDVDVDGQSVNGWVRNDEVSTSPPS